VSLGVVDLPNELIEKHAEKYREEDGHNGDCKDGSEAGVENAMDHLAIRRVLKYIHYTH
jgi:hypothetical protein